MKVKVTILTGKKEEIIEEIDMLDNIQSSILYCLNRCIARGETIADYSFRLKALKKFEPIKESK